jgi:hypothetical protein
MNKRKWVLLFLLLVLILPARVAGVDRFATYDEPWWVISGSNFYYALTHREFTNTVYDYHPAVTTMWVVTAGMVSYFPQYRVFDQGYFDVRKPLFENFMREKGMDSLPLVRNSRLIQIALIILLALLSFFLLQMLIDDKAAFLAIALAMNAPFFMGMSRLLNHEAMLAMFSLVTLLAMQVYLNKERKWIYLIISGVAFGLAQLTKSSSIVLIPLVGLMLLVSLRAAVGRVGLSSREVAYRNPYRDQAAKQSPDIGGLLHFVRNDRLWFIIKIFLIWFAVALLIYILLWPGMWVAPLKMLNEVYGNAFSYALQGGRLDVTEELQPQKFTLAANLMQVWTYANQWKDAATPLSWLGLMLVPLLFFWKDEKDSAPLRSTLAYLFILAALYMLLFGMAQGRDSSHYVLTSFVSLDALAGIGLAYILLWIQKRWQTLSRVHFIPLIFSALLAFQLFSAVSHYPYYYTYKNPFVNFGGIHGYGEGLDQAAEYLAQKPGAKDAYVIAYAGRGCFSYFYPGRTDHMKVGAKDNLPFVEAIQDADYLVVYNIRQKDRTDGAALIRFLEKVTPEHIVAMDGFEYARIYRIVDLPEDIYATLIPR